MPIDAAEFLDALPGLHFGRVEIALPVHRDVVQRGELAGLAPGAADREASFQNPIGHITRLQTVLAHGLDGGAQ